MHVRIAAVRGIPCFFGISLCGTSIAWWAPRRGDWIIWSIGKPYFW